MFDVICKYEVRYSFKSKTNIPLTIAMHRWYKAVGRGKLSIRFSGKGVERKRGGWKEGHRVVCTKLCPKISSDHIKIIKDQYS